MSTFSTQRQEIADALSTVTGITGYAKRPTTVQAGDAVVYLAQIDHVLGVAYQARWRIVLVLSSDEATSIDQMDEWFPQICEAVNPVAFVDTAIPEPVKTSGGDLPAVTILARSE